MQRTSNLAFFTWFVFLAGIVLLGWFSYWEIRNRGVEFVSGLSEYLPVSEEKRAGFGALSQIAESLLNTNGEEKTFLVLFQNNLELRPGGGFIGSFGVVKVRDGHITEFSTHDTGNFDGRIPDTVEPPYPMREYLRINSWKFRDSNYAPDFPENAKQALTFYAMAGGSEQFDGVVGITANVLSSILTVTGPVTVEGYPGTYGADNAILDLEYQVEQAYTKQGIEFGERKSVIGLLGAEILKKVKDASLSDKAKLFEVLVTDLKQKDIQMYFADPDMQDIVAGAGWDGAFDERWEDDFLFAVDANLGAYKSDYHVKRAYRYTVDLTGPRAKGKLEITYTHTAKARDWFTKDYLSYLRLYLPEGTEITRIDKGDKPVSGTYRGKSFTGVIVSVPLATTKTVTFEYTLPEKVSAQFYDLKIQKQAGLNDIPVTIVVKRSETEITETNTVLNGDFVLGAEK